MCVCVLFALMSEFQRMTFFIHHIVFSSVIMLCQGLVLKDNLGEQTTVEISMAKKHQLPI